MEKYAYICKSDLKSKRGWTDMMIKKFLPTCDLEKMNPYYRHAAPILLYSMEKVEQIESSVDFIETAKKSSIRKLAAKKRVEMQIQKAEEAANSVKINIPILTPKNLLLNACASYDSFHWRNDFSAFESTNPKFLNRIQINFLRHECTNYDEKIEEQYGKVGVQHYHDILQSRINDSILKNYPYLSEG